MATITLTAGANTRSWTISAADLTRLLDAIKRDAGNPALTTTDCFNIIANRFQNNINEQVKGSERVATAIPDVVMVPVP